MREVRWRLVPTPASEKRRVKPSHAAWILTALFAVAVSASVYRIPIRVSDSVEILEAVDETPSIAAAFTQGLHARRGRCCARCVRR